MDLDKSPPCFALPPLSLYVHFPWCVRKCPYCDFNSYTLHGELPQQSYLEALERDLRSQAVEVTGRPVISVFLGGGTPSLFSPEAIHRVLATARRHLALACGVEVTLEANPGAIERGRFREYREAGVTRVSLGAQSFEPERLAVLGRIHSPEETRRAAHELHAAGLPNFNLDLMYALSGQEVASAVADIEAALALDPTHISHYQLTLEPGTVFAAKPPPLPEEDVAAEMLQECAARLAAGGFARYEISAYARHGRRCRHNLNYWGFGDYLGIGAGAHGKLSYRSGSIIRTQQPREPRRYIASVPSGLSRIEVVPEQRPFEFMLNVLRLTEGFEVNQFTARTGLPWRAAESTMHTLVERGLIVVEGARYRPSELGLLFLNDALWRFLPHDSARPGTSPSDGAMGTPG
jgi:oxygen-independent coproporphyrinogen-3 oxidase